MSTLPFIVAGSLGCGAESTEAISQALSVSKPTFANVADMQLNGGASIVTATGAPCGTGSADCRLRLASSAASFGRSSAFLKDPVNLQQFYIQARLRISGANADGLTFTVHTDPRGASALGGTGGGLGSGPDPSFTTDPVKGAKIANSVSLKLDVYDNEGEGANSTGVYLNGAKPTVPATTIGNGIDLHDGQPKDLKIVYALGVLAVTITDVATGNAFNAKFPVDVAGTLGGTTGYAGFTSATGALDSQVEILSMTANFGMPATRYSFEYGIPSAFKVFGGVRSIDADAVVTPRLGAKVLELDTFCPPTTPACIVEGNWKELAAFIGVPTASLDQVNPGSQVYEGSAVSYTITAAAGDIVRFDWNFTTEDSQAAGFDDFAFVSIGANLSKLASTFDATTPNPAGTFGWQTGWKTFGYQFTSPGTYTIALGVADATDGSADSSLLIDNVRIHR